MTSLKKQAEDLGIEVDRRWSDDTLREKIKAAKSGKDDNGTTGADVEGPSPEAAAGAPMSDDGEKLDTEATPKAKKSGVVLDEKTMLQAKAIELLVEVDPEWDEDRLRAEIQQAREGRADLQVKGAIPPSEMADPNYDSATKQDKVVDGVEVELTRDYWDSEDHRVSKGSKLTVSRTQAREMLGNGLILPPQF